ncbi:MAG: amino acid permease [Mogibacterium sp.]|nr:amino acid permease [Mogibacterium sp.]
MSDNTGSAKKIGLFTATMLAIGTIIGSGILGTLPSAVSLTGKLTFICIIVAAINVFFSNFVNMIIAGVIPVNAGPYMYLTRLVHPIFAITEMVQTLCGLFLLALMGTIFGSYFNTIFPAVSAKLVAILVILLFGILNLFGIDAAAKVGNILVILLFIAFILFSFFGFTVDTSALPNYVPATTKPLTFVMVGTVSALFVTTLSGGSTVAYIADSLKDPRKDIARAFILSLVAVVVLYSIMSFATVRAAGSESFDSLATLSKMIMPSGAFYFFMIGGAFTAITSTINGLIIQNCATLDKLAEDQILPEIFVRRNKYGVQALDVIMLTVIPIIILAFNLDIFTLLSVSSVLAVFTTLIKLIPCLTVEKKYPKAYAKAYIKPKFAILVAFVVIAAILNIYSGVSTIITTAGVIWIVLAIMLVLFTVYFLVRAAYLKGKGVDLWGILKTHPQCWIDAENN